MPYLPPGTVHVKNNAPCHGRKVDKPPSASAALKKMFDWLVSGMRHSARKEVLYTITNSIKPTEKTSKQTSF
jgi:hypothetical protein